MKTIKLTLLTIFVISCWFLFDQSFKLDSSALKNHSDMATKKCFERTRKTPPKPFTTDACSMVPNGLLSTDWSVCCIRHDYDYWCGGTDEDRARTDADLKTCLNEKTFAPVGSVFELGVHFGGTDFLPTPWRWGYGY